MVVDPLPPEAWAAEGRRIAPELTDVAAAIITGRDANAAAAVALAIASAHAAERRVAVADLVGGIELLAATDDLPGLLECLRDGTSLTDIARPLRADGAVFVLPSGRGAIAERWVFESARWERLIGGFREVDALLLLVTPPSAPGLETLIRRVDGVIPVDLPPTHVRTWPLLATVDRPEAELPPIVATPTDGIGRTPAARRKRRWPWAVAATAVALVGTLGTLRFLGVFPAREAGPIPAADGSAAADTRDPEPIRLDPLVIVNPRDSARATGFSVEIVAANTLSSANSRLAFRSGTPPAAHVAPVLLAGGTTWYRATVGAWSTHGEALDWLDAARARGELSEKGGRVLATPLAFVVLETRSRANVEATQAEWLARGVMTYALRDDDGMLRLYAGAFEGPAQAAVLAMTLRELATEPKDFQLAYRIGRTF